MKRAKAAFEQVLHTTAYRRTHEDDLQLDKLYEFLSPEKGERILDIGTGNGYVAFYGARQHPRTRFTGIDIASDSIAKNAEEAKLEGVMNIGFDVYDGVELPYKDEQFSKVVTRYAFHHFPEPETSILQIDRVLSAKGKVVIADALTDDQDDMDFINRFQFLKKDGHVRFYSRAELIKMFEARGFVHETDFLTRITYSRRYNEHYIRLVKNTPSDILSRYNLSFINDQVFVTVTIANMIFRKN